MRKNAADIRHSTAKNPLNSNDLDGPSGMLAVDRAVAIAIPSKTCMAATPIMARAMPAARNRAANAPTAAAMITMKKPMPSPSSRTIVVHTLRNDATSAAAAPAR